ncbi:Rid family hydrolase [Arthrobacter sp. 2MCAF15]|uniref:Rid family hydrolase n=1 Tax=Arthrobacter sp. 2MCAF15 TaxID=3232984 RepID=UPI003F9222D3
MTKLSTPVDWNAVIGFCPVKRVGPLVVLSGTSGIDESHPAQQSAYDQTKMALRRIAERLASVGGTAEDIVGVRLFLQDIDDWQAAGRAHGEIFGHLGLALTMVEARLVDPRMRVEIEATAWVSNESREK